MKQSPSMMMTVLWSVAMIVISAHANKVSPIQKVVTLMTQLQGQVIREGELASTSFKKYSQWCETTSKEKQFEIKKGKSEKDNLEATIDKCKSDSSDAQAAVEALSGKLASDEADTKAITLIRQKEGGDFEAMDKELTATVSALSRARMVLKKELAKAGMKAGAAFLQSPTKGMQMFVEAVGQLVSTAQGVSAESKQRLAALLQLHTGGGEQQQEEIADEESDEDSDDDDDDDSAPPKSNTAKLVQATVSVSRHKSHKDGAPYGKPEEKAYESRSGNIIETLEKMSEEAEKAQAELRKKEQEQKHLYEMLKARLTDRISTMTKELDEQKKELASAKEKMATSIGKLERTIKDLKEDQKYVKKLQQGCMERASEFEVEMSTRKDELAALAAAKKTVQSIVFAQVQSLDESSAASFLQLGSGTEMEVSRHQFALRAAGASVAAKLKQMAVDERSVALAQLAARVTRSMTTMNNKGAGGADPFKKVKNLIQNMIAKLEKQQAKEAALKKFCDTQMAQTKANKKDREGMIEVLSTRIEETVAEVAKLKQQKTMLLGEIKDIGSSQAEMDNMRKDEHKTYVQVSKEMKQGLQAVQTALKVLREFYSQDEDKEGGEFIQDMGGSMRTMSQTGSVYAGAGGGTAIINLLEVCESDFSRGLAEATSEEDAAQDEYDKLTQANKIEGATKDKTVEAITSEVARLEKKKSEFKGDRTDEQTELDAINEYLEKITKQCVAKPESYHDRVARRKREIQGLEQALSTLEAEADE